ncbi:histidine phosphatase family protein [Shewanella sp. SR1]|uniref:histidine phosphatase family protein n=1 Tax=Shewanella sp. SR1 TaxID=2855505 RepID=UPI001CF275B9|nr:histidine phosphatase family protein [Shewanella sp. SR1]MCB2381595.1 histidine phosphatase family protein [Shewanella sp. SR1]
MIKKTIYLLRHGQTQFNAELRLQAQAVGEVLKQHVYSVDEWAFHVSPLGRAVQTAEIICQQIGFPVARLQKDARLIEFGLGDWEQQRVPDIKQSQPELSGIVDWYTYAPNAESFTSISGRLKDWLNDPSIPERVIVVSHALSGAVFRGIYADLDYQALWAQDMPQDAFFKLEDGKVIKIKCL